MHVYSQSKKTTQSYHRIKRQLFTAHLNSFNLTDKAPQHAYKNKGKATLIGKGADRSVDQMCMEPG